MMKKNMKLTGQQHRIIDVPIDDGLFPGELSATEGSRRYSAMAEVLCRISEKDYVELAKKAFEFQWFIPHPLQQGSIVPFPANVEPEVTMGGKKVLFRPTAVVLYLSPGLEKINRTIVVAIVAHEMAHIVLGHKLFNTDPQYEKQETEVYDRLCSWGFEIEAKAHQKYCKARDAFEKKPSGKR